MPLKSTLALTGREEIKPRAQIVTDENGKRGGIAVVNIDGFVIQSVGFDTMPLRALAAALLDAVGQAQRLTDLEDMRLDRAAAAAVNSNRATEPFGTVPSAMPARVTSSTAPEPFDSKDVA